MALAAGQKLGLYEILSPLGAGGMGEVYKARDTRLQRDVAIKVLPEEFFEGEERRQRFEREARLLAALNHPNIAAIYSFEEISGSSSSSSRHLLVMELVEGEGLDAKIASGPLPLEESLSLARQIAEALEAAHEKGIVHRDLKPANVKVSADGRVKLLDFGLAKAWEGDPGRESTSGLTQSPTLTARATAAGMILGTAAYMSPEQARGKPVDKRADIWAFGVVLWEMLTGKRLFEGETVSDVLAAVLRAEPDWAALPEQTPAAVRRILRKCLQRDPRARLRDIADARLDLEELAATSASGQSPFEEATAVSDLTLGRTASAASARASRKSLYLSWAIAAAFAAALAATWAPGVRKTGAPAAEVFRLGIPVPEKSSLTLSLALSPDGKSLVFAALGADGTILLWLRPLSAAEARPVRGTEDARFPFWSPDSRAIGFFASGKLKALDVGTGTVTSLCDAPDGRGGSWGAGDVILFAPTTVAPLSRVSARGGTPSTETSLDNTLKQGSHRWPYFLPDGRRYLFLGLSPVDDGRGIFLAELGRAGSRRLTLISGRAEWVEPGGLLCVRDGRLVFQRIDLGAGRPAGDAVVLADGLEYVRDVGPTGASPFSASRTGIIAWREYNETEGRLLWRDRAGKVLESPIPPGSYSEPYFSPDGRSVTAGATFSGISVSSIWTIDLARGATSRLTFEKSRDLSPCWSPDGSWIAYSSQRDGKSDIYRKAATGVGAEELLWKAPEDKYPDDWTADGKALVVEKESPSGMSELWLLPVTGDRTPAPLLSAAGNTVHAAVSPDGRYVAYVSDETGRAEVYVQTMPPGGGKWQVSTSGGDQPTWRKDGKELYFLASDGRLMATPVATGSAFSSGSPVALFDAMAGEPSIKGARNFYAPWRDGSKFLTQTYPRFGKANAIQVLVNWRAVAERR